MFCRMNGGSSDSKRIVQASPKSGGKKSSKPNWRSSSALTKVSNTLINPPRLRKRKPQDKKINGLTSAKGSPRSLRFEVEETVTTDEAKNTSFERFCHCTSLHGWKYLSSSVNFTLRIGWVGVVLAAMGVAAFFLGYCCNDFLSSTVQTSQDTSR